MTPPDHDPVLQFHLSDKLAIARIEVKLNLVLSIGTTAVAIFGGILGYLIMR